MKSKCYYRLYELFNSATWRRDKLEEGGPLSCPSIDGSWEENSNVNIYEDQQEGWLKSLGC